jgi:hypothetical protein
MKNQMKQTKKEKLRVQIARDVLKHLNTRGVKVKTGQYVDGPVYEAMYERSCDLELDQDAQKLLRKVKPCTICAKGAILIAHVLRNDKMNALSFQNWADGDLKDGDPTGAFPSNMWRAIETLFERDDDVGLRSVAEYRLIDWAAAHLPSNDKKRLRAIMNRIIKTKGNEKQFYPVKVTADDFETKASYWGE